MQFELKKYKNEMDKAVDFFASELTSVRTGRAHTSMLNSVKVQVYGSMMPINQVANITVADAQMLMITPFDNNNLRAIVSAIRDDRDLNLNPSDDGKVVRVPVPAMTEERRLQVVKMVSDKMEEAKVRIRIVRQDAIKDLKKLKESKIISEDEARRHDKEVQESVNQIQIKIEDLFKQKKEEVLTF